MKILRFCCALLCSAGLLLEAASAQTPGATPSSAAPAGVPIAGILECGEGYTSHELYDVTITLEEVLRGDESLRRLRAAAPHTPEAPPGLDYVLARVRFEYRARGFPGTCVHPLAPEQFTAYSREGEAYAAAPVPPPGTWDAPGDENGGRGHRLARLPGCRNRPLTAAFVCGRPRRRGPAWRAQMVPAPLTPRGASPGRRPGRC